MGCESIDGVQRVPVPGQGLVMLDHSVEHPFPWQLGSQWVHSLDLGFLPRPYSSAQCCSILILPRSTFAWCLDLLSP